MQGPHSHLRAYTALVLVLIFLGLFLYGLYSFFGTPGSNTNTQTTLPTSIPMPTPQDEVSAQQPFQYLVSYTVSGFHPTSLSIQEGQTVRFTNNSSDTITIT